MSLTTATAIWLERSSAFRRPQVHARAQNRLNFQGKQAQGIRADRGGSQRAPVTRFNRFVRNLRTRCRKVFFRTGC